jgi:glycosyltransferase involved in cell wall biosynthesis
MASLLIVTHIDFWRQGAGHRTRLSSLITFLKDKVDITLVYAGLFENNDSLLLNKFYPEISIEVLEKKRITFGEYQKRFAEYIDGREFDFALVEYIEMSFVLPFLNTKCITFLDTHDLASDRIESFRKFNLPYFGIVLTREEEFELFQCFDYVIAIQKSDYTKLTDKMDKDRVLLVPHPSNFQKKIPKETVEHVGYVASGYAPNVDALNWFLKNIWPSLYPKYKITLNVYGDVGNKLPSELKGNSHGVIFHGFVPDLDNVYNTSDIMINPVRCGAGLKIKNVEALGNGLPLVTTHHGAIGIEDGVNTSFLVADTAEEFTARLEKLIQDFEFRTGIGHSAFAYAEKYFSAEKCYQPLLDVMLRKVEC